MFDFVEFRPTLPDGFKPPKRIDGGLFQTKSFHDPSMTKYIINKRGRLYVEQVEYQPVPENKRPYYGTKKWHQKNGQNIWRVVGSIKKVNKKIVPFNFTGHVIFYGENKKKWHEYKACFIKGKLQSIVIMYDYWPNLFREPDGFCVRAIEEAIPYLCE